jgi:LPXTG-site transpeptidase (sortase) family protein
VRPTSSAPPAPSAPSVDLIDGPMLAASAPRRLEIPALDVMSTALVPLGLQPDGTMEVPEDGKGVGWYTGAPTPGALGPAVLAAHVDWAGELGVFHELHEMETGDSVLVGRADGSTEEFRVTRVEQYPKDRFPTEEVYGMIAHAGLRLITCGGEFDEGQDSYRDNIVVYAQLVDPDGQTG